MKKSIVGELVGKRGIVYAPINRAGVLLIFSRLLDEFEMLVEETAEDCSYIIARRRVDTGQPGSNRWERVRIALAYESLEMQPANKTDTDFDGTADLLICWQHNWPECPLETFELRSIFADVTASLNEPANQTISLNGIIPEDSGQLLKDRVTTQKRFEKAVSELDEKIKKLYPGSN
ncbi:MAG: hypothetical protein GX409_10515 [candidate division Zixibacteria bacterium]|jgi:hypothetical protein|nr:hypothetical protein [candidate division Zixibacteria bacterium]